MNTLWQCPLLFHLCLKWKINGCSSSYVGRFCLRAINHRLYSWDPPQPTHSSKTISNLKFLREQKAEWWSEERGRRVLTGGWCDWTPSSVKCWTCSQIYKGFLRTCVRTSVSYVGKLSKATTKSLLPFFFSLFVLELCNLRNCHSVLQLIQGGHAIRITTAALCTFLKVFTVHLVMFHIHLWAFVRISTG